MIIVDFLHFIAQSRELTFLFCHSFISQPCLGTPGFVGGKRRSGPRSPATYNLAVASQSLTPRSRCVWSLVNGVASRQLLLSLHNLVARASRALAGRYLYCEQLSKRAARRAKGYTGLATRQGARSASNANRVMQAKNPKPKLSLDNCLKRCLIWPCCRVKWPPSEAQRETSLDIDVAPCSSSKLESWTRVARQGLTKVARLRTSSLRFPPKRD